ncbi:hypothetical protein LCGC14_1610460 [marine sediment metagenome]|uniref:Uncharacterized protein n=1 Tax=marine sediment metagenome TaxID=412755 RepID=A0A0F9I8P0_9ZZZZ
MTFEAGLGILLWFSVVGIFVPRLAWAGVGLFAAIYLAERAGWF